MGNHWTLEEAGRSFAALVEAARRGEPQSVGEGGEAVVVVSGEEYQRLVGPAPAADAPEHNWLSDHLQRIPKLPEGYDHIFDKSEPFPAELKSFDPDR